MLTAPLEGIGGGIGLGHRLEVDQLIAALMGSGTIAFSEMIAESIPNHVDDLPPAVQAMLEAGVPVIPHGVRLGLGDATPPSTERLRMLARAAELLGAPLVSEHLAFVRAGPQEIGHLTPVPRTRASLAIVIDNVRRATAELPVPLAVENAAALFAWPEDELTEAEFLIEVLERTDVSLLLDLANVVVTAHNCGTDPADTLDRLPMERVAYVHVAGGEERNGLRHDTHTHTIWPEVIDLVTDLARRAPFVPVLLERDGHYPPAHELEAELQFLAEAQERGRRIHRNTFTSPARLSVSTGANRSRRADPAAGDDHALDRDALDRDELEARHRTLALYLVADGAAPEGFPIEALTAARAALRQKRCGEVAGRLPALAHALGAHFAPHFARYADQHPPPEQTGADVAAFVSAVRHELEASLLTEAAAEEVLRVAAEAQSTVADHDRARSFPRSPVRVDHLAHRSGTAWRLQTGARVRFIHR